MAMTIRNKKLETSIRRLGAKRGLGPTAVIRELVEAAEAKAESELEETAEDRAARYMAVFESLPKWTDEELEESRRFEADMYDENGLPK